MEKTVQIFLELDGKRNEVLVKKNGLNEEENGFGLKERAPHPNSKNVKMTNQSPLLMCLQFKRLSWRRKNQHATWLEGEITALEKQKEAIEMALEEMEAKTVLRWRTIMEMTERCAVME